MKAKYDFSGWATKNDIRCSDGRTIRQDAFKDDDGRRVPLVWQHLHDAPENVLGHAILENRSNGVYAYCSFNKSEKAQAAKELVKHGDICALSIYANQLRQRNGDVLHGCIREVSVVLAGANPGAMIDVPILEHADGSITDADEATIYFNEQISLWHADKDDDDPKDAEKENAKEEETAETEEPDDTDDTDGAEEDSEEPEASTDPKQKKNKKKAAAVKPDEKNLAHAADLTDAKPAPAADKKENKTMAEANEKTVQDVFDELTDEQKNVVYFLIGKAVEDAKGGKADDTEEDSDMKHNVFENDNEGEILSHTEMNEIIADSKRYGSLRESALQHGITNIDYLFPDAQLQDKAPGTIKRDDEWVSEVMNGTHHTPFTRIKSIYADLREDEARAKGYIKGKLKKEEFFSLIKRTTAPTTVYKKQKLDRDDVIDITDFDVVSWIKAEMRVMLNEELARAILIGDGRTPGTDDKIDENCIRPIWTDADLYTIKQKVTLPANATDDAKAKAYIRAAVFGRKDYRGSGNPVFFTSEDTLNTMLLMEDTTGRIIYDSVEKLCSAMRVRKIVTVPQIDGLTRSVEGTTHTLVGIIVNLTDYTVGADKGGNVSLFDDFDIDYNAQKYLIETRCSGSLTRPYSAIAIESVVGA